MAARKHPPLVLVSVVLLIACFAIPAQGQIRGVPASVTSLGFGGNTSMTPGVAASVTSLGPNGYGNAPVRFFNCCTNAFGQGRRAESGLGHGRHGRNPFATAVPVYAVPYTQVFVVTPEPDDDGDDTGGPTVFDRRGDSRRSERRWPEGRNEEDWRSARRSEPAAETPAASLQTAAAIPKPAPVVAQPSTVLVFRDGHQAELLNYAIVGPTIFDLAENRAHKILLADIDLEATRKANEARGVDFQVPAQ